MNYTLKELLDIPRLQDLLDSLNEIHQMPSAIIDTEGTILTATAWQDICTQFHRVNSETARMCRESDRQILSGMGEHTSRVISRCPMGLVDAARAIVIEGTHLGSVFTGQFLMEAPDESFFVEQARLYGFDHDDYLDALRKVPLFSEEQLTINLNYIEKLTCMLAEQGLHNKRQREAKAALRESEARFRSIFDQSLDAVFNTSPDGTIISANPAACRMFGMTVTEIQQVGRAGIMDTSDPRLALALVERLQSGRVNTELTCIRKNGERFPAEVSSVITAAGAQHSFVIIRDISERKRAEEKLLSSEASFRAFFEQSAVGTGVVDISNRHFVRVNKKFSTILGYSPEELQDVDFLTLTYPEDCQESYDNYMQLKAGNIPEFCVEKRYLHRDGHPVWVTITVAPLIVEGAEPTFNIVVIQDISSRKQAEQDKLALERQLLHTQKLESLGVLAGGIAHDFNNILAIIIGYCGLTKLKYETAQNNIPEIEKAAERAAGLCRQMLTYAGKAERVTTQVNMGLLVDDIIAMVKSTLSPNAQISTDLTAVLPPVHGDPSQLRQIVMNLIINASEAIGTAHGEIQVTLSRILLNDGHSGKDYNGTPIAPGAYVCLEVRDNGCGMDNETQLRLFEPFYTTKFTGRGLGMSAVLGIIMSHGGAVQLFSQQGQGTTFKVYLPVQIDAISGDTTHLPSELPAQWTGTGTVLLVEDEDQIRYIAKSLLELFGFTVIEAVHGKEALELYQKHASSITLVVTDMGMPIMDGCELFHELKSMNPELPIIISSGFGDAEVISRLAKDGLAGIISKPYGSDQLREVLKNALGDKKTIQEL